MSQTAHGPRIEWMLLATGYGFQLRSRLDLRLPDGQPTRQQLPWRLLAHMHRELTELKCRSAYSKFSFLFFCFVLQLFLGTAQRKTPRQLDDCAWLTAELKPGLHSKPSSCAASSSAPIPSPIAAAHTRLRWDSALRERGRADFIWWWRHKMPLITQPQGWHKCG